MKLSLVLLLFILASCGAQYEYESRADYLLGNQKSKVSPNILPLQIKVTDSFSTDEFNGIQTMGDKWSAGVSDQLDFFDYAHTASELNHADPNSYLDSEMGIYRLTSWPNAFPSDALAITQTYGERKNVGQADEYVEIYHVDILINDEFYDFSNSYKLNHYDLQTVMIHELGHSIGLNHYIDPWVFSVMSSEISQYSVYTDIYAADITSIGDLYFPSTQAASRIYALVGENEIEKDVKFKESYESPGLGIVRVIQELRPGSERTYINGHLSK